MVTMRTVVLSALLATALVASGSDAAAQYQATTAQAQATTGNWQLLAQRTAGKLTGSDTIELEAPYQNFHSIKFRSEHAAVHIKYFLATYENGVVERVDVNERVEKDGESSVFKLTKAGNQNLRQIRVWYDTAGFLRDAKVSFLGMK